MKEYTATIHAYKAVKPPRCKLERLEPVTETITMPLHYAESAPVAMRVKRPLEYTSKKDGTRKVYSSRDIELLALDGMLWKPYGNYLKPYRPGEWTIEELADICAECFTNSNPLERWPWQWSNDNEPPTGMLVRDRGTWATVENISKNVLDGCNYYASIGGNLYEPANELVYTYEPVHSRGYGYDGYVILAQEYQPGKQFTHYLCNALQDWRKVNPYTKYAKNFFDDVSGVDVIEVLLPEYVTADPHADNLRAEIEKAKEKAANCNEAANEHMRKINNLREDVKRDKEAAKRYNDDAQKFADELEAYLVESEA